MTISSLRALVHMSDLRDPTGSGQIYRLLKNIYKTYAKRIQNVYKTYTKHIQNVYKTYRKRIE